MRTNVLKKKEQVEKLTDGLKTSSYVYVVDYQGISANEIGDFRKQCREASIVCRVVKNTLLKKSLEECGLISDFNCGILNGPTAILSGDSDEVVSAKILSDFSKKQENNLPTVKGGLVDKKWVDAKTIKQMASLPSKEQLYGMVAGTLNSIPTRLVLSLSQIISQLGYALNAVKDSKEN